MKTCYDPEIPVDIVNLGLIYDVSIKDVGEGNDIHITMTLTAPGCGFGPMLVEDVTQRTQILPTVNTVHVELVFDPPWSQEMMSPEAKLRLNMF